MQTHFKQECIPVGCVLTAAVGVCWGLSASVYAEIHPLACSWTPRPGPGQPPGVSLDNPPNQIPKLPPESGPRHPPGLTPNLPLGVDPDTPLGVRLDTPETRPPTSPLCVCLESPLPTRPPKPPTWVWA